MLKKEGGNENANLRRRYGVSQKHVKSKRPNEDQNIYKIVIALMFAFHYKKLKST
jgi:hypothetical protein